MKLRALKLRCCARTPIAAKRHNQPMTLTELRYIVAVACEGRKRAHTEGGDRSPQQAGGDGDAINHCGVQT
jgi:hypothetical protein